MTNIFKYLKKNEINRAIETQGQSTRVHKRDVPAVKNWYNSVYAFRKNSTRFLPAVHQHLFNILKAYFNMTNAKMEKKSNSRKYKILRRLSGRKIWVSNPEIKHFNDKMNITVYVYNRLFIHYKKKLPLLGLKWLPKKKIIKKWKKWKAKKNQLSMKKSMSPELIKMYNKTLILKRRNLLLKRRKNIMITVERKLKINKVLFLINVLKNKLTILDTNKSNIKFIIIKKNKIIKQILTLIGIYIKLKTLQVKSIAIKNRFIKLKKNIEIYKKSSVNKKIKRNEKQSMITSYMKIIRRLKQDKLAMMNNIKLNLLEYTNKNKHPLYKLLKLKTERYNYLIKSFKMELIYLKFMQNKLFNEFKFNELYLTPLINMLESVYKKKVEFNIVSLKHSYLSSSILSQIVVAKIKTKRNRGRAIRAVDQALVRVKPPVLSGREIQRLEIRHTSMQNIIFSQDNYNLDKFLKNNTLSGNNIKSIAMANVENKNIAGVFIKVSGRLTKRFKAQRAINILRYKGTLKNVYSAYRGYSSSLLRGHENINVEKTILHSKVKIGAFGLKGWVSSH